MKRIILLALLIIASFGFGQEPVIEWEKSLGGSLLDQVLSIQQTTDGGYIIAGDSDSNNGDVTGNNGDWDFWVVKLDTAGDLSWQNSLGGSGLDYLNAIRQTLDGGYIIAGYSESNDGDVTGNNGNGDCWVVKLDATGNMIWEKSLGGSQKEIANSIQQTTDGNYIVAGWSESNDGDVTENSGGSDYWIVKLDASGNIIWEKSLGGSGNDWANSIELTSDNGFIVAGQSDSNDGDVTGNNGSKDYWVVKLDSVGGLTWQKSLGGSGTDRAFSIQQTTNDGYIIAGWSSSNDGDLTANNGNNDAWIVQLDSVGTINWQKSFGGSENEGLWSIQQAENQG
ncbi:MAG: hypothetical protein ACQERC_13540 [Bacteroidota bacterium]